MKDLRFIAIITGPEEYLPGGFKRDEFVITQEDIDEYLSEDDGTEEDAINYYKEEYIAEWAQRWCTAQLLNEEKIDAAENIFNDDDGEEEAELDKFKFK